MRIDTPRARGLSMQAVALSWQLVDPAPSYAAARIELFRSQDHSLGQRLAELPGDSHGFVDREAPTWRLWTRLRYTVRAVAGEEQTEAVVTLSPPGNSMGLALADQIRRLLRAQMGIACWQAPRKAFGDRCPDCYDEVRGRPTRSHCATCYDTSIRGGYGAPERLYVGFRPGEEIVEQAGFTEHADSQAVCWVANYPDLGAGDLLIEPENRRWRVVKVQPFERLRTCFRQVALVDEIERDQIEYELPCPGHAA